MNDKNDLYLVKAADETARKHLIKWSPGDSNKIGPGTTDLANHTEKKHSTQYKEAMELIGTKEERNAPVAAAIGGDSRDCKKLQNYNSRNKKHSKNKKCEHFNISKINEMKNGK